MVGWDADGETGQRYCPRYCGLCLTSCGLTRLDSSDHWKHAELMRANRVGRIWFSLVSAVGISWLRIWDSPMFPPWHWTTGYKILLLIAASRSLLTYIYWELNILLGRIREFQSTALSTTSKEETSASFREERISNSHAGNPVMVGQLRHNSTSIDGKAWSAPRMGQVVVGPHTNTTARKPAEPRVLMERARTYSREHRTSPLRSRRSRLSVSQSTVVRDHRSRDARGAGELL
ncbi:hypothetical protein CRENBAI_016619 [Crenichthys baileyi]|uniref:Uncharacterized protein n=1 Tax=Crenichthys baileyi TaxID=28760 RepID=A0AAV9S4L2_9TELE